MKNASFRSGVLLVLLTAALAAADDVVATPASAVPAVSAWLPQVETASAAHEASARALAQGRERALAAIAAGDHHASPWLVTAAAAAVLTLMGSALWRRLAVAPRALTRSGLAVDVVADRRSRTTVIALSDPNRISVATAPDRARLAAVRAAAALADEPPTDPAYVRSATTRIVHKHETRQWQIKQRARIAAAKQAGGRPTVLRRA